jgi:hypothetical protein
MDEQPTYKAILQGNPRVGSGTWILVDYLDGHEPQETVEHDGFLYSLLKHQPSRKGVYEYGYPTPSESG